MALAKYHLAPRRLSLPRSLPLSLRWPSNGS
ncbi:hypothetical protein LINPERPRIM_LOCUS2330 [Linum perenne]